MSKRLGAKKIIPIFYTKGAIELITFTYFRAKLEETTKGLNEISRDLQHAYGWTEEDYPLKTIVQVYSRMNDLYRKDNTRIKDILNHG